MQASIQPTNVNERLKNVQDQIKSSSNLTDGVCLVVVYSASIKHSRACQAANQLKRSVN